MNLKIKNNYYDISDLSTSELQADVFVKYMNKAEFLMESLENKTISPRYVSEDVSFLDFKIGNQNIKKLWIPMTCFCDIPLNRINNHIKEYGAYGIALKREWGIKNKLTPINYLLPDSEIHKEIKNLIAYANNSSSSSEIYSFILNFMFYSKPIQGIQSDRKRKFIEEQEWRFVPDISKIKGEFAQFYYTDDLNMVEMSNLLKNYKKARLNFGFEDIKYLIVPKDDKLTFIEEVMNNDDINNGMEKYEIVSKIICISEIMEDFI